VICVNAVDKGDRERFGVKAVDKGVRDETRKSKSEIRKSKGEQRNSKSENRNSRGKVEGVRVQKGKELGGVGDAGRAARGDFTGYDRVG
jgi:hypothetical protein